MKKTLLFLFCGIAALCVSCKEGDDAATRFSFSLPEVVSVGSTTADVNSRAGFTLNDYPESSGASPTVRPMRLPKATGR